MAGSCACRLQVRTRPQIVTAWTPCLAWRACTLCTRAASRATTPASSLRPALQDSVCACSPPPHSPIPPAKRHTALHRASTACGGAALGRWGLSRLQSAAWHVTALPHVGPPLRACSSFFGVDPIFTRVVVMASGKRPVAHGVFYRPVHAWQQQHACMLQRGMCMYIHMCAKRGCELSA